MAIFGNQKGFWVKRGLDTNPTFVSVGGLDAPDSEVEKWKAEWAKRNTYTGDQASNNVQWVGEDPTKMPTDLATQTVTPFTPSVPDPIEENYFDTALREVEESASRSRGRTETSYRTLVQQMKEGRELFNKNQERDYGRALENININAYARGVGDSGIKTRDIREVGTEKALQTEEKNLFEKQKLQIADEERRQRLEDIATQERRSKYAVSTSRAGDNPYAKYSSIY